MSQKGVIVEFDFAAMDGATLLFETARRFLRDLDGIALDAAAEARYLAGGNYPGAFAEYFAVVRTKKTALKAGRDFALAFRQELAAAVPKSVTAGFRNFVAALAAKGVRVAIATRAPLEAVAPAFADVLGPNVTLYFEESQTYGCVKWDAWRRACAALKFRPRETLAVTGSGLGVRSALRAGLGSVAVTNPRVAYQDFTGVDEIVGELNVAAAKAALNVLRIA